MLFWAKDFGPLDAKYKRVFTVSEFTLGGEIKKQDFNESRRIPIPITSCGAAKQWLR